MPVYNFKNNEVIVHVTKYRDNDQPAITLMSCDDGMPYTIVTVNVKGINKGEVAIKNHSENEGMLQWLVEHNIVEPTSKSIKSGWVNLPVCRLLPEDKWIGGKKLFENE